MFIMSRTEGNRWHASSKMLAMGIKTSLENQVAIVTGAGRGIGQAIALELASQGAKVAICARSEPPLLEVKSTIEALGGACFASSCDVKNESDIGRFVTEASVQLGSIDILVNNAGIYKTAPVQGHPLDLWQDILATNLTGAMLFCRAVLSEMIERKRGRIINISSISGRVGEIWGSAYSASKFGMIGLTQSLALEVAKEGITVNAICPGWVSTELAVAQLKDEEYCKLNSMDPKDALSNACFSIPQNRFIEPGEVAALVAFLSSDGARGITGQSLNICGGMSLQ